MPFTLVIECQRGKAAEGASEKRFGQSRVAIGRGAANDLVLKDPQRMVSSKHAEIREKETSWVLIDVGSTNGTGLNERRLQPNTEYPLTAEDRIELGSFILTFRPDTPSVPAMPPRPIQASDDFNAARLLYLLRRAYAEAESSAHGNLSNQLKEVLLRNLSQRERPAAQALLASVRDQLAPGISIRKEERSVPQPASSSSQALRGGSSMHDEFAVVFLDVVSAFCGKSTQPLSKPELDRAVSRVTQILEIVFTGIADAVRGRREFQKEFEVEATQILSWRPNPIKQAETAKEIGALLLNPEKQGLSDEQVAGSLKEIFQDLTLHQLGLLAGFRECVRGLLKELDPAVIGKPAKGESTGKGIGLLSRGSIRSDAAAWRKYIEKHQQLTEEEVKVFERILAPHFAKGYLAVHKARRRS